MKNKDIDIDIELTKCAVHLFAKVHELLDGKKYSKYDEELIEKTQSFRERSPKFMELEELQAISKWKVRPWKNQHLETNEDKVVEHTTKAFEVECESQKIEELRKIPGVNWAMASAVLHFAFLDESIDRGYPILDVRTMRTVKFICPHEKLLSYPVKLPRKSYSVELWRKYIDLCRDKAKEFGVSLRDLDRALWTWDKCGFNWDRDLFLPKLQLLKRKSQ